MKISTRGRIGRIRYSFVVRTVKNIQAITSRLEDGNHIIMWDFDGVPMATVLFYLGKIQESYLLPPIHISSSSNTGGYHAYCLYRCTWLESLHIVSGTKGIDPEYVSMAAWRKRWTLRLSDKGQGVPTYHDTLPSQIEETVAPVELTSWVDYEVWSGLKATVQK